MTEYETSDRDHKVYIRDEMVAAFVGMSETCTAVHVAGQPILVYGEASALHQAWLARTNKRAAAASAASAARLMHRQ